MTSSIAISGNKDHSTSVQHKKKTQWHGRTVSHSSTNNDSSIIRKILTIAVLLFLFFSEGFALQQSQNTLDLTTYCPQYNLPQPTCYDFPRERPINRCFTDVSTCGCYPEPTTPNACFPMVVDKNACYSSAMKDARDVCAGEEFPLVPLPEKGSIDLVSWSAKRHWAGFLNSGIPKNMTLTRNTWVTSAKELKDKCSSWKYSQGTLKDRVNQLLGLPPTSQNDVFIVMRVGRDIPKRPCVGLDTSDSLAPRCSLIPSKIPQNTLWDRNAFCDHMNSSFLLKPNYQGFPFTALGYTFDWSPTATSDYGLTEFVLPKDSVVTIQKIVQADEYCNLHASRACRKSKVVVIGGGVAGLTAATEIERLNRQEKLNTETLVITGPMQGGAISKRCSTLVNGWHDTSISGYDLAHSLHQNALDAGVKMSYERVTAVDFSQRPFQIFTNTSQSFFADSVIIATGFQPKPDPLRGATPYPDCNGVFYDNRIIGVMGGGYIANVTVDYLSQFAQNVFLYNGRPAPASPSKFKKNVQVSYNSTVVNEYCLPNRKTVLEIESDNMCRVQYVDNFFVAVGSSPKSSLFHIAKKEDETIRVNSMSKGTSVKGVFAIGAVSGAMSLSQAEADGRDVAPYVLLDVGC